MTDSPIATNILTMSDEEYDLWIKERRRIREAREWELKKRPKKKRTVAAVAAALGIDKNKVLDMLNGEES